MERKVLVNDKKGAVVVIIQNKKYRGRGVAKCNLTTGDQFIETTGVKLADKRAVLSYQKAQRAAYQKKIASFLGQAAGFAKMVEQINNKIAASESEIQQILETV